MWPSRRIYRLISCSRVRLLQRNILIWHKKKSDGEAPVMRNTPSLTSLPYPLWPRVAAPDGVLSMSPIELNCIPSSLAWWVECSPRVQSQVAPYQKLFKWYLIPPCLTLSNIRYVLRVKWSNPGKGVAPPSTLRCSSYWKGAFWSPSTTVANFTYFIFIKMDLVLNNLQWLICHKTKPN